jgi:hypothetical protein
MSIYEYDVWNADILCLGRYLRISRCAKVRINLGMCYGTFDDFYYILIYLKN